jgi:hypothetical protein
MIVLSCLFLLLLPVVLSESVNNNNEELRVVESGSINEEHRTSNDEIGFIRAHPCAPELTDCDCVKRSM